MKKSIRIFLQVIISIILFVLIAYYMYAFLPELLQAFDNIGDKYPCPCGNGQYLCQFTCTRVLGIDISPQIMMVGEYLIWLLPLFISAVVVFLFNIIIQKFISGKSLTH